MEIITFDMVQESPRIIREITCLKDDTDVFMSELIEEFTKNIMDDISLHNFIQNYSRTMSMQSVNRIIKKYANEDTSAKVIQHYLDIYSNIESLSVECQMMIEKESLLNVKRNIVFVILLDIAKGINIIF